MTITAIIEYEIRELGRRSMMEYLKRLQTIHKLIHSIDARDQLHQNQRIDKTSVLKSNHILGQIFFITNVRRLELVLDVFNHECLPSEAAFPADLICFVTSREIKTITARKPWLLSIVT